VMCFFCDITGGADERFGIQDKFLLLVLEIKNNY